MDGFHEDLLAKSPSFYAFNETRSFGMDEVIALSELALGAGGVARVNLHRSASDALHSMLIAQVEGKYWQPKRHLTKCKSFHIVRGRMLVLLFDASGSVLSAETLSTRGVLSVFVPAGVFHTNLAMSSVAVHHEVIQGPYFPGEQDREWAPFAPCQGDTDAAREYLRGLLSLGAVSG